MQSRAAMRAHRRRVRPSAALAAALLAAAAAWFAAAAIPARAAVPPVRTWQLPGAMPFEPTDVAILADGRLAIADARSRSVLLYDRDGKRIGMFARGPANGMRSVPIAVAGNPLDGTWYVAGQSIRGESEYDLHEVDVLPRRGIHRYYEHVGVDGVGSGTLGSSNQNDGVDLAVRPLDGYLIVHPRAFGTRPNIVSSGLPKTDSGQPRIAVWRNNWIGLTQANGRPFEVYASQTSAQGERTVQLRKAITFTGEVPIAVGAGRDLLFHVLVRPVDGAVEGAPDGSGGPLVRIVGGDLTEVAALRLDGVPIPPATDWPWAIDVGIDGDVAISTAGELFQVARFDAGGRLMHRLVGGRALDRLVPTMASVPTTETARIAALAAGDIGPPVVADRNAIGLLALDPSGAATSLRPNTPALDIATAAGAVFTVDDLGRVHRFERDGEPDPRWSAALAPGGARIAAAGDRVYVTQPISRTVLVLDASTGAVVARRPRTEPGVWPDDVAATADGTLYAIDAARGVMDVVSMSGVVSATWPVGLAAAPRFVAVADIPGGRVAVVATDEGTIERYDAATGTFVDRWQPAGADGKAFVPGDVAVGRDGTIYLAQSERGAVHAYSPIPVPTEPPASAATPTPGPLACQVYGTKGAAPRRVVLGHAVDVSITLRAACPGASRFEGADVLLVVDRSGSMARGGKVDTAKAVAVRLARAFAGAPHRVGLVTFAGDARLDVPLGANSDIAAPLHDVPAEGVTDLAAALALAHTTLDADRRPNAVPLAVVISDGRSDTSAKADALAADGILVASVIVGDDASRYDLESIAAAKDLVFDAGAPGAAAAIHRRLLTTIFGTVAGDWTIDDALGAQVELVEHSPLPPAARSDDMLRWARPVLPPGGITLTYQVRPLAPGRINTNRFAWADYTDADGARRRHILPIPVVDVITPTPSPTPTPTAMPVPPTIYLPLALTERCRPVTAPVDAVLVVDASTSMLERTASGPTKLDGARTAMGTFLDQLRLASGDRASIVAFHSAAVVAAPLTGDRGRLDRALAAIVTDRQTCLVCGVDAAMGVLDAAGHRPDRRALIVLLTDGRSNPRPASEAVARAAAAKATGAVIYTIGLGSDIDADALAAIASSPKAFVRTSDAAALVAIYRDIARDLPCPVAQFWGRR